MNRILFHTIPYHAIFRDLGVSEYRGVVMGVTSIRDRTTSALLTAITNDRCVCTYVCMYVNPPFDRQGEVVDGSVLRNVTSMLSTLSIYTTLFEPHLIEASRLFYISDANASAAAKSVSGIPAFIPFTTHSFSLVRM